MSKPEQVAGAPGQVDHQCMAGPLEGDLDLLGERLLDDRANLVDTAEHREPVDLGALLAHVVERASQAAATFSR